jgi:nitrogen regulatory protein PII
MIDATSHTRRLVTVITEAALERELTREFDALGLTGYTITDARGRGHRGERSSSWTHTGNIRIEIICDASSAARLIELLHAKYYDNYAMVLHAHDVEVLRPERFR